MGRSGDIVVASAEEILTDGSDPGRGAMRGLKTTLTWVAEGTALCRKAIDGLDEVSYGTSSPLPGWSRQHVVAHLAGNAEAIGNLLRWARTGARRAVLGALAALALVPLTACGQGASPASLSPSAVAATTAPQAATKPFAPDLKELEREFGARLGVYALDTGTGREVAYNDGERFAYASTFKALAAGAVLQKYSLSGMDRLITYSKDDLVANSPVTERHVATGMSLGELCDAAVRYSDNTAANLLFDTLGGPKGLDGVLEELGDDITRMERLEPGLSQWAPGETRDTTTPRVLAKDLRAFVLGDVLGKGERAQLTRWLRTNTTGNELIRAGMPKGWVVGDKTGAGSGYGARNDIAVVWPPHAAPLVMAIMSHRSKEDADYDNKLIAGAASVVADTLS